MKRDVIIVRFSTYGGALIDRYVVCVGNDVDLSELDLPKKAQIRFPEGKDKIMNFELVLSPDEGLYRYAYVYICIYICICMYMYVCIHTHAHMLYNDIVMNE